MSEWKRKVAVVTGGGRGIGKACAIALAEAGAKVVIVHRSDATSAARTVSAIRRRGGHAEAIAVDVADSALVEAAFDTIRKTHRRIDVIVHSAGIWEPEPFLSGDGSVWRRTLEVNLEGAVNAARAAARAMAARRFGRLVFIGSTAGIRGESGYAAYAASKGALFALVRSLAAELAGTGITANVVSPGWVLTDMTRDALTKDRLAEIESAIPTGRISKPDDVAAAVMFLASDGAGQVNGGNIDVNGGVVFS